MTETKDSAASASSRQVLCLAVAAVTLVSLLLCAPQIALGQQWFVAPELAVGAENIDNPRLAEEGEIDNISGGIVNVGAVLQRNTQTSSLLIRPTAEISRYSGDTNEDQEAYFLDFDGNKDGQRSQWRFRGNFRQQQVYRGEVTNPEPDEELGIEDSVETGTGRTQVRRRRDILRLRPGFTFDISQRTSLRMDVNWIDVSYDNQELGAAVDYTNSQADIGLLRSLTPDSSLQFGLVGANFDPDSIGRREAESIGGYLRYTKDISDVSSFLIDVGGQESTIKSSDPLLDDISDSAVVWNIGYRRRLEVTAWSLQIGQAVTPSGAGVLIERNLARVTMNTQLSPRLSLGMYAVYLDSDSLGGGDVLTDNDREQLQGQAVLDFEMSRSWRIEALYRYTNQNFKDIPGDASQHLFRLSVVYQRPVPTS